MASKSALLLVMAKKEEVKITFFLVKTGLLLEEAKTKPRALGSSAF
jgi:hypothetical protein